MPGTVPDMAVLLLRNRKRTDELCRREGLDGRAHKSGAVTRITGIIHALVLVVSMFLLSPVMSAIPLSALAGVLLVTAFRMNEWEAIRYMFSHKFKGAILKYLVTMAATARH